MKLIKLISLLLATGVVAPSATLFSPTNMTSQQLPTPYVATASSAFPDDPCPALPTPCGGNSFAPYGPFRSSIGGGGWTGMHNGVDFLKIDIGAGASWVLSSYKITGGTVGRMPLNWTILGSNDDSSYFLLDTQNGINSWVSNVVITFTANGGSIIGYRYFKMAITANNNSGQFTEVNNFQLFGDPPSTKIRHEVRQ